MYNIVTLPTKQSTMRMVGLLFITTIAAMIANNKVVNKLHVWDILRRLPYQRLK